MNDTVASNKVSQSLLLTHL